MQIYLAVAPSEYQKAATVGENFIHIAYRIGTESTLLRQSLPIVRGGLLSISDRNAPPLSQPEMLCDAVMRECSRRGYGGVTLDFEERPREDLRTFAKLLESRLRKAEKKLYIPESYMSAAPDATILFCTAVSGGNFKEYLRETIQRQGGEDRIALDVERLQMDFCLPSADGKGTPLTHTEFLALFQRESPIVFFSPDLCARYFTYTHDNTAHFVLFDDADTLIQKLKIGKELGIQTAFLMWPEVEDLLTNSEKNELHRWLKS